ncbi:hypothetical protein ROHU_009048 [Labeo rohita]|uniref:Uncharacterized protein n=1 Tax=Labeo rohita TaxID=84645 RepID=A0A498MAG3_LABRO|nr:hypothetical protein ROHU_009048 [Labeo rohita]
MLRKRSLPTPSSQVMRLARNLLSTLGSPGEKEGKGPEKSVTEPEKEPAAGPAEEEGPGPSKNHSVPLSGPHAGSKVAQEKKHQWSFYGHLTAYWASIYGHRSGVFQNLTIQEVEEARQMASEGCFVIKILAHKTNQAFGAAQLALDQEAYGWVEQFLSIWSTLVGGNDVKYFFFTSKPSSCKNLNQYFQDAWASMGLPGMPTFTDMRTAIATHCYALNLDAKQAAEHRRLFDAAVVGEEGEPDSPKQPKTSKRKMMKPRKRPAARSPSSSPPTSASPPHAEEGQESREVEEPAASPPHAEGGQESREVEESALVRSSSKKMHLRRKLVVRMSLLKLPQKTVSQRLVGLAKK